MHTPTRHQFPPSSWPRVAALSWLLFGVMATWAFLAPTSRWDDAPTGAEVRRWFSVLAAGIVCLLPMLLPSRMICRGWRYAVSATLLFVWTVLGISLWVVLISMGLWQILQPATYIFFTLSLMLGWLAMYILGGGALLTAFWLRPAYLTWVRLRTHRESMDAADTETWEELPEDAPCAAIPGE